MAFSFNDIKRHIPGVLGLMAVFTYLGAVFGFLPVPRQLMIVLILAIGPVAIYGVLAIGEKLSADNPDSLLLKTGTVYGIVAFAIWIIVHTIQQGGRIYFREKLIAGAADEGTQQIYRQIYQAVNTTQVTADVGFDIFYCLLIVIFSIFMYKNKDFGRITGLLGILSAGGLLVFNLWTFPFPPADSGLVDLGPLTGVWWLLVIIQMYRTENSEKELEGH